MNNSILLIGFFILFSAGNDSERGMERSFLVIAGEVAGAAAITSVHNILQTGNSADNQTDAVINRRGDQLAWWVVTALLLSLLLFLVLKRQALAKKIAFLEANTACLFDHAPCGYHVLDETGTFVNVNATLLHWLGYNRDELVNKKKFADIVEGERGDVAGRIAALMEGRVSGKIYLTLLKKSGGPLPVILTEMAVPGPTAAVDRRLFSTIDNTACHEALERVRNLDQELDSFSYSISHDLRAPLRSINGYSKILQEDYAEKLGDEGRRVLNVVMNNAQRMGKLIDDLLEFGRLGRKTIQLTYVNMTAMANSIVQEQLANNESRNIEVVVGELDTAFADADMIRLVWFNLLENAFKFTGKTEFARIEVRSVRTDDDEVCYEVKDNGVGFDMKYAPKIFDVFQRLHKMQDFTGTGVGLAIVKRIISRHGGRVWAEGSLETGAIFYFTIPKRNENT